MDNGQWTMDQTPDNDGLLPSLRNKGGFASVTVLGNHVTLGSQLSSAYCSKDKDVIIMWGISATELLASELLEDLKTLLELCMHA